MAQGNVERLNEAFQNFSTVSKSLENSYSLLQDRVAYLTTELEVRNQQLKEALDEAERNKDYLNAVLYNLEEAIVVVDPAGKVSLMNRSAEALLRTPLAAALGRPFAALDVRVTGEDTETLLEAGGERYQVIISRSDVVDSVGCLRGRVILIKDITRLRELELRHERNQRLIAMGEMAAKLVHEIRNPLCSIELFSSMLEKELTTTAHRDLARGISAGIGSLNNILTNMLFFARPNKSALKPIRLDQVIADAIGLLTPLMASRKVTIAASLAEFGLCGDAELLKQVLMNILINAAQAMPEGGDIDIAMAQGPDGLSVLITDTGAGIARENLEKIFDPFFTTKDDGTGLGLVIASTIMQATGGYITAASEPGQGSTFTLHFPSGDQTRPAGAALDNVKNTAHVPGQTAGAAA